MSHTAAKDEIVLKGTGVCPGIVVARARVFLPDANQIKTRSITEEEVKYERARFQQAMEETRRQLQHIRERVSEVLDEQHAQIFDAHLLVAEDHVLIEDVEQAIEAERLNVEPLLVRVAEKNWRKECHVRLDVSQSRVLSFDVSSIDSLGASRRYSRCDASNFVQSFQ